MIILILYILRSISQPPTSPLYIPLPYPLTIQEHTEKRVSGQLPQEKALRSLGVGF